MEKLGIILAGFFGILLAKRPIPSEYRVSDLQKFGCEDELYSGYMPLKFSSNYEGSYFFWLAKQRHKESVEDHEEKKLVIWLNGGPGCSSMTGMMWENGPFTIHNDEVEGSYKLKNNPYSWNEVADVLFVDQPIRAGYSMAARGARLIKTEHEVAQDFHDFLLSFLEVFSEFQNVPVYITGESYAGAYIPWIADYIVRRQESSGFYRINLQGIAIGNGVIDYFFQVPSYAEYAYSHGLIPLGAKQKFDRDWENCIEQIEAEGGRLTRGSFGRCNLMGEVLAAAGRPNEYDTRTFVQYDSLMQPDGPYHRFFNDPKIQEILHVRGQSLPGVNFVPENIPTSSSYRAGGDNLTVAPNEWVVCNNKINSDMDLDRPTSTVPAIQYLINRIRVLLYSGEADLNCNTLGTLHTLEANAWLGTPWSCATRALWRFDGDVAGEYFNIGDSFAFLIVRNSGHLLPMDKPATALEMLRKFLVGDSFADVLLPNEASYLETIAHPISKLQNSNSFEKSSTTTRGVSILTLLTVLWNAFVLAILVSVYNNGGLRDIFKRRNGGERVSYRQLSGEGVVTSVQVKAGPLPLSLSDVRTEGDSNGYQSLCVQGESSA